MSIISQIIFSLLFFSCMGYSGYVVRRYWKVIKIGQKNKIETTFVQKIKNILVNVVFQKKMFKHPIRGLSHVFIFYGFILYSLLHTPSQFIGGFIGQPTFYLPTLIQEHAIPYFEHIYDYIIDIFSFLVLAGVCFFGVRRWIFKAKELDRPSLQSFIILFLIGFLMIFTLIGESAKMYAYPSLGISIESSSFIRYAIQSLYVALGWDNIAHCENNIYDRMVGAY